MEGSEALRALYKDFAQPMDDQPVFDSAEAAMNVLHDSGRHAVLQQLHEQALAAQWDVHGDVDWNRSVNAEQLLFGPYPGMEVEPWFKRLTERERRQLFREMNAHVVSQLMHGENAALFAATRLVSAVQELDAKCYLATQAMEEAQHVEAFRRYGREKLCEMRPVAGSVFSLYETITHDTRADFRVLGMQVLAEGLVLAALMHLASRCREPLLHDILCRVLADEARHVSYGVLTLQDYYTVMPERERRERQEFVLDVMMRVRGSLVGTEPFQTVGIPAAPVLDYLQRSGLLHRYQMLVFANLVPNLERIGLLEGLLAERFAEMDVLDLRNVDVDTLLVRCMRGDLWEP